MKFTIKDVLRIILVLSCVGSVTQIKSTNFKGIQKRLNEFLAQYSHQLRF